jgi:hypothetical protein
MEANFFVISVYTALAFFNARRTIFNHTIEFNVLVVLAEAGHVRALYRFGCVLTT